MAKTLYKASEVDALLPPWSLSVSDASHVGLEVAGPSQPQTFVSTYKELTQSSLGDGNPLSQGQLMEGKT
jgi:hypothetical protein